MGDIRFSYNDDFNKMFLRPSQFVADRFLRCKSMVFAVRKYGFCGVKVWCLWCESMVFAVQKVVFCVQKYGFLRAKVWFFVGVRVYIAICSQRCCRPSAALLQSVSSCRGPIYRARIYVNAHEMEGGNVRAVM